MNMLEIIKMAALDALRHYRLSDVCVGVVTGVKPLTIETNDRLVLPASVLVLSRNVTDYQTWLSLDDENVKQRVRVYDKPEDEPVVLPTVPEPAVERITDIQFLWTDYKKGFNAVSPEAQQNERPGRQPTKHRITVYNHLMLGERVLLIKQQGGQRYYVVDRLA